MRWWICWKELILTRGAERIRKNRGKYGLGRERERERERGREGERAREGEGSDVASARETPKLVSTRGLNNNGMILPGLRDPTRQRPVVSLLLLFRCYDIRRMV